MGLITLQLPRKKRHSKQRTSATLGRIIRLRTFAAALLQHTTDRKVTGIGTNPELPLSIWNVQLHGI